MARSDRHLLSLLQARQTTLGLLDVPFAKKIGISQSHWSLVKREQRGIGHRMSQRIIDAFPDLYRDVEDAMFPRKGAA